MNTYGLIDADILIVPKVKLYEGSQDFMSAIRDCEDTLHAWLHGAKCDNCTLYFSGPDNWRKHVYPGYKSNRPPKTPAFLELLEKVTRWFKEKYDWVEVETLEADDLLAYVATTLQTDSKDIILSGDKDFYQVPGWFQRVGNLKTSDEEPHHQSLDQADYVFYLQWMGGDSTDGFKGIPGIGEKKAQKLLDGWLVDAGCDGGKWLPHVRGVIETNIFKLYATVYQKKKKTIKEAVIDCLLNCWMCRLTRQGELKFADSGSVDVVLYKPEVDVEILKEAFKHVTGGGSMLIKDAYRTGILASAWKVV